MHYPNLQSWIKLVKKTANFAHISIYLKENTAWKVPSLHFPLPLTQCCFEGRTMTQPFFQRQSNIDEGGGGGLCCWRIIVTFKFGVWLTVSYRFCPRLYFGDFRDFSVLSLPAEFENSDLFVAYQGWFVCTVVAGFSGEMGHLVRQNSICR